jgi:hypothetical protein
MGATRTTVTFRDQGGVQRRVNVSDVQSVEFNTTATSGAGYDAYRRSDVTNERARVNPRRAARMGDIQIPAGTDLTIRTEEEINSETASTSRYYDGVVNQDVMVGGQVVIPRGSDVDLVVREVQPSGTVREAELQLGVHSVEVNGRRYLVSTQELEQEGREGIGANRRTAEMIGGGAAVGAIIGAIAGGGKGAAIGGAIGAAAGGAAQVLTKGKRVRVPAESTLTFRLDQPVTLQSMR